MTIKFCPLFSWNSIGSVPLNWEQTTYLKFHTWLTGDKWSVFDSIHLELVSKKVYLREQRKKAFREI